MPSKPRNKLQSSTAAFGSVVYSVQKNKRIFQFMLSLSVVEIPSYGRRLFTHSSREI